jgi:hypothetical protein
MSSNHRNEQRVRQTETHGEERKRGEEREKGERKERERGEEGEKSVVTYHTQY